MLTKFWEAVGGKLGERWLSASIPAAVFWLAGLGMWIWARGSADTVNAWGARIARQPVATQVALLLMVLAVVAASGAVVSWLAEPVFRLAEGYWPLWALRLWRLLSSRLPSRVDARGRAWQQLHRRIDEGDASLSPVDYARYLKLDRRQRCEPAVAHRRMPTKVGAILRAAEARPYDKYGLETVAVWPQMWLILPDAIRQQLSSARQAMIDATSIAVWGILFLGFTIVTPWAGLVAVLVAGSTLMVVLPGRVQTFADLVEATFDLHRIALYRQLRWPLPQTPAEERAAGLMLTQYLWRGSDSAAPTFTDPL